MLKKLVVLFAALSIMVVGLTACKKDNSSSSSTTTSQS